MTYDEYRFVSAEANELESMLAEISRDNLVNRLALEHRLKRAKKTLQSFNPAELPKKARLTFRGEPVFGSHGAVAEFAAKASGLFTEAFFAIVAGADEKLRYMGPIPDKQKNQLLVTGTAIGSFGFEFELPAREPAKPPGQTELFQRTHQPETAMEMLEQLLEVAASGTDDQIAEIVDEIHPRAVKKAAEFMEYLSDQGAWCGLEFNDKLFRFSDLEQIRVSAHRLTSNNIKESDETFLGEFQGVLPTSRSFEFKLQDQAGILRGKVGSEIEEPDILNREYLHKFATVTFRVIQVGQGRPRYTLASLKNVSRPVI